MLNSNNNLAPGARVEIRGEEWLVRRRDTVSNGTGGYALSCIGLSELVRDVEANFLTEAEDIRTLRPEDTVLVEDTSQQYSQSILYIESLLRKTAPTDHHIYVGHKAAMNLVPYQLDPTIQALAAPRQRILIADAVGLGKTLEAGILLSELIVRGKGKRILVLTVKSMLTQFQKEMWSRFSIPMVRLDSAGINRIRNKIPSNQNPFYYYDKTIISIDTLKRDREYRYYLENSYWDIIVIDEAHNVAERGSNSQRARLAKLIANRSDTLLLLSATPHDGSAESFASLMNMLDPTAIANPQKYGPEDIKQLYIRRFKKDIQNQVENSFKERSIYKRFCPVTAQEEAVFDIFVDLKFYTLDGQRNTSQLFKTTLEKSLLSSPAACLQTVNNRLKRLELDSRPENQRDIQTLTELKEALQPINAECFGKYLHLLRLLKSPSFGWTGRDPADRLVIFTERIETLRFLAAHIKRDLHLADNAIATLYGEMGDMEQQDIVQKFGQDEAPVRLMIASDVASEGINLHFLSHRMIHFDIPWSLMTFQQRNGRIDRYGQERNPEIHYLVTETGRVATRILEVLIEKDQQAMQNIGDPSVMMGVYDVEKEEEITAAAIESKTSAEDFAAQLTPQLNDLLDMFLGTAKQTQVASSTDSIRERLSLYPDDFEFLRNALQFVHRQRPLQFEANSNIREIRITAPDDLKHRFQYLPEEIYPDLGQFVLTADQGAMQREIKRCRKDENAWPTIQYLWPLHPILDWAADKVNASLRRQEAPVLCIPQLAKEQVIFLLSGLIPNRKGHPLIHEWFGVTFDHEEKITIWSFDEIIKHTGLGEKPIANIGGSADMKKIQSLLSRAILQGRRYLTQKQHEFEAHTKPELDEQIAALVRLKGNHFQQLELDFQGEVSTVAMRRKESKQRTAEKMFADYQQWIADTMTAENNPYIQVVAVLKGGR